MVNNEHLFRVGLTGGIACGKSFVAELFAQLAIPVIDTDEIARQIVAPGQPGLEAILAEFGPDVLMPSGELDRTSLRSRVFADESDRRRLEAILHPRIRDRAIEMSATLGGPYQIMVVPLLIETHFQPLVDRILVVDCPESLQRERLVARDNEDTGQVDRIMSAQLDRMTRLQSADDVIDNAGTRDQTRRQVESLHRSYLTLASAQ
jgi:dephospho-CoA kinase